MPFPHALTNQPPVTISSNPFARTSLVRVTIHAQDVAPNAFHCAWCGTQPTTHLFQYGISTDWRTSWDSHLFCSKPCRTSSFS